jgi:predicted DNA-binding transcriptional regulator AlpA
MDTDPKPVLINAEELARIMDISERTLWRLLSGGKVPQPVRIGRNTRWRLAEVEEWIASGCPAGR